MDLIPLSAARELARLQESKEPSDPAAVRVVVERELGRPVEEVFAEFDWRPLAAASLGRLARSAGRHLGQHGGTGGISSRVRPCARTSSTIRWWPTS